MNQLVIEKMHSDRKSTRLNSSHLVISYAVFCLKKQGFHRAQLLISALAGSSQTLSDDTSSHAPSAGADAPRSVAHLEQIVLCFFFIQRPPEEIPPLPLPDLPLT